MIHNVVQYILLSASGNLVLRLDEQGTQDWCQFYLNSGGVDRPLGAEGLRAIANRLLSFLVRPAENLALTWVFSLCELHCSMYGELLGSETRLEFQDAQARSMGTLTLTFAERREWIARLAVLVNAA